MIAERFVHDLASISSISQTQSFDPTVHRGLDLEILLF